MPDLEVPFQDGMKVGRGYDRLTGDVMPSLGAVGTSVTAPVGADGQAVTLSCSIVQDVETLHQSLGISVDAGGSYMGFSGSAKVDYLHSCDLSTFSTYVVVHVTVGNSLATVDEPALSPDASELVVNGNPDRFRQRFADGFVSGIKAGGEYFAIYQLTGSQQTERQSLAVKVQAAFNDVVASAHLNASINTAMEQSKSHLEVNVFVFRQGTIKKADLNLEDIMATARDFPVAVQSPGGHSFPYAALVQPYSRLKSPNDTFNYVEIQNQQDVLADLARKRFEFLALRDDYSYILAHLADFKNADGTAADRQAITAEQRKVVASINTMQSQAAACARDAKQCSFAPFDVGEFARPIAVAPNSPSPVTIRVPNLVGLDAEDLERLQRSLPFGTVDEAMAGTGIFAGQDGEPHPSTVSREIVQFIKQTLTPGAGPRLRTDPNSPTSNDGINPATAQIPSAGTLVTADSEVLLQFQR